MTGNLNLLINFVWKFLGNVGFRNDHVAVILGYDLEVAFRRNTRFVKNLKGIDLLKGNRTTNLYTINLYEMAYASPICFMARATSTKSWLWHQRLSHLNFDTINDLAKNDLVHFLKSKDEAPEEIKTFLKKNIVLLQAPVIIVRTENGMEFKNQVLKEYFDSVGISHHYKLIGLEILSLSTLPGLYLRPKAFCYPKNDHEDIGKLGAKGDIGFFISYSTNSCAYRVYNRRTKKIMETMNVTFDELSAMAFEQRTIYDDYIGGQPSATLRTTPVALAPQVLQTPMASTITANTAPTPTNSSSQDANIPNTLQDVDELQQPQHVHP
ncbi:retrovirus-related pol polyprotein from transposon TNT 1-94 [Tanacetum coccineum]